MTDPVQAAIQKAADALRDVPRLAVAGHIAPDGDAIGSALGIAAAARAAGVEVVASFSEPFTVPDTFRFLPVDLLVVPEDFPKAPEVMVACDTASLERLGSLVPSANAAGTLVVLDHHPSNDGFGDIQVIDPAGAATAELAYRLIRALGWPVDRDAATALYTGLVTDTGRFQYSSTSPATLRLAAELLEAGAAPAEIGQQLYERVPFGYLKLSAVVLGRAELDAERSLVWTTAFSADFEDAGIGYSDADPLIDDLRIAREAEVALLIKQVSEGFKGSLRSRGRVDVGAIAVALGGGGHHNASGFNHPGPPTAIAAEVAARLDG